MKDSAAKVRKLLTHVAKIFNEHPQSVGETYLQHLWVTAAFSARFFYSGTVVLVHGFFPFLATHTASKQVEKIYTIMKARNAKRLSKGRIAIVGGGFSGALVLANIVKQASGDLTIEWFEPGELGTGMAYGTKNVAHLLNVRANFMGAFADKPEGFWEWLQTPDGKAHTERLLPGINLDAEAFVPRMLYADYLRHIVQQSLEDAKHKGIIVNIHPTQVTEAALHNPVSQQIILGGDMLVDALVLATGNLPPHRSRFQTGLKADERRYVDNVWDVPAFPVQDLSADSEIVIIGSGLTMVDSVLTLRSQGYKGIITAISRNGLLPAVHSEEIPYPAWEWVLAPHSAPRTALGLLIRLRQEVKRAEKQGYHWRDVVNSIRPVTQQLWQQLDTHEKRRFLSRLSTFWMIHRHRMAPDIDIILKDMQKSGRLRIISGKIYYIGSDTDSVSVAYRKRGVSAIETLRSPLVINCTGPEYDITACQNSLLRTLRERELIHVGALRVGIELTEKGSAKGRASEALFPIGTLMMGGLLECTAVPELRERAQITAQRVLERVTKSYAER